MARSQSPELRTEGLVERERLRRTLHLIHEAGPAGITRKALAKALGDVSDRTVDRALGLLEDQGARFTRERRGQPAVLHFSLEKGPDWDDHISTQARLALRLASLSLSQAATSFMDDRLEVIESLVNEHMSSRDRRLFETLQQSVQVHGGVEDPLEAGDVLEPILQALEQGRELEVLYRASGQTEAQSRTVVPFKVTLDIFSGGSFLALWDPKDNRAKHFRLCRIQEAKVGRRRGLIGDPTAVKQAAEYQIGGWTTGEAPFQVRARIEGTRWMEHFREAPPALPGFEAHPGDDQVEVRFLANHLNGAARWLLQFGGMAEVLEPESLRAHVRSELQRALAHYGAPSA